MKKCTYCGKEYPDNTAVCAIDAEPLEAVKPPSPLPSPFAGQHNTAPIAQQESDTQPALKRSYAEIVAAIRQNPKPYVQKHKAKMMSPLPTFLGLWVGVCLVLASVNIKLLV